MFKTLISVASKKDLVDVHVLLQSERMKQRVAKLYSIDVCSLPYFFIAYYFLFVIIFLAGSPNSSDQMNSRYDSSPAYAGNTLNMADRKTAFGMPESNSESNSTDNLHIDDPMSAHGGSNKKNAENGGCEKQQKKKSPTVLELVKTFGESTSMHGLARAIGDGPLWRRLIWAALVIGFAIWAAYNVVEIIQDFLGRPVLTTVSSEFQTKMIFPAVTFCNLNRVRNSKASANLLDSLKINLVVRNENS